MEFLLQIIHQLYLVVCKTLKLRSVQSIELLGVIGHPE